MYYPNYNYYRNNMRFGGPLVPFLGGLLVGGLFLPRPNTNYYPYPNNIPNPYPANISYMPYITPANNTYYIPSTQPLNLQEPSYLTSIQKENMDIYPYQFHQISF